jgi:hypothetical protein
MSMVAFCCAETEMLFKVGLALLAALGEAQKAHG